MNFNHQQQWMPKVEPAGLSVQRTEPVMLGYPQNTFDVEGQMAQHAMENIQSRMKIAVLFQNYRARIISNKYNVTVTSDPASVEERVCLTMHENKKIVLFNVKNAGDQTVYLTLLAPDLVKNIFTVKDFRGNVVKNMKEHKLGSGEQYKVEVHIYSEHAGFYEQLLVFKFGAGQQLSDQFEIMRLLEVRCWTPCIQELLPTPTNSLCIHQTAHQTPVRSGVLMCHQPVIPLNNDLLLGDITTSERELQTRPLNWHNYSWRFHLLLHLEELHLQTEMCKYTLDDVPLFRHENNMDILTVQIPGVSNNFSSQLQGNNVLVFPLNCSRDFQVRFYKGFVCQVEAEVVCLKFDTIFLSHFEDGMRFSVKFEVNRMSLLTQHKALNQVYRGRLKEVLFPTGQLSSHCSHLHRLLELENNPEQQKAVQHILAGSAKPAPYLVFGPPGTGKTGTLVEAMKQILKTQESCSILACAPSNSAADHICEKILEGNIDRDKHKVYRLYALNFPVRNIPPSIKSCCNLNPHTFTLMIPTKEYLMRCKIVVTTLLTAARLVSQGIPPGHYTYIFVDEAGQAAEPQCIVPIAGLLNLQICQVVLAGDPKQLGPTIQSTMAAKHGLGVSLLERLMRNISLYKPHERYGYNNWFVTKLLRNYRSHPAILKVPNELFYEAELQTYALKKNCCSYCNWEGLPKKGFPLIFHGVAGTNERDTNNPSVYNMAEVEVLKEYLKSLIDNLKKNGTTKIKPGEIGIITPYRKQVEKIQIALQMDSVLVKEDLENVLVGSVEQFQGKEFNVILVSTVRSNPKLTAPNQQFTLGFVNNMKRFNVAMTRARALLIVVGDPRVLKTDQTWNKFIYYCYKHGAYCGITVSDTEKEEYPTLHSLALREE